MRNPIRFRSIDWRAAACAGLVAGGIATALQMVAWWMAGAAVEELLARDAALTAAVVLGRDVLQSSSGFAREVFLAATLVHLSLSLLYGLLLAPLIAGRGRAASLGIGVACGLLLFGVNLYGFTLVFPWFAQARDAITLLAHAAFGAACAGVYKAMARC
jgi:hypothetical protein